MLIQCKLKRKGGTKIDLFGQQYHFKPADDKLKPEDPAYMEAPHVAEITDNSAIHRLCVGIKEGYAPVDPEAHIPRPEKVVQEKIVLSSKSGKPIDPVQPVIIDDGEGNTINLTEMEPEALRKLARDTFHISVHHKWPDATVIAKIVEKTRGQD